MNPFFEKLAILIPTRNRPGILAATLKELQNAGLGDVPLWIYDDCSADPQAILNATKAWPQVQVISGKIRVGQAEGRNVLMRACGREFGLFLDDDSFLKSVTGLEKHLNHPIDSRRAIITFQYVDVPTHRYSTRIDLEAGIARSFQGGGSLFHIPSILGLGGFRSFFIYGYEEPELSCRLHLNGLNIWYDPSVVVHHNHFETPAEFRNHAEYDYLYARNSILMSSMNLPLWFGLPYGLLRSLRRSFFQRRYPWPKVKGTLSGLWLTFTRWKDRTPCESRKIREWLQFNRSCPR